MAYENRVVILGKFNEGMTNPKDISKSTGIPQSTVYRIVKKIRSGNGIDHREVEGRPKKLPKWTAEGVDNWFVTASSDLYQTIKEI